MQAKSVTRSEQASLKKEVKRTLMELADELDEQQRDIRIAKTSFASAGVASAGAVIGGLVLAPFTAGVSLIATAGGLAGGALSGAGTLATNKAERIINSKKLKAAQKAIGRINESYSHCTSVEGETGGNRAAATGITTMLGLLPPVLIGLNIAEIVSNSIKIDKKSPSEVAEQIRAIARMLD
ncbi:apolipoprotein L3-like isoform X2 [Haliotis rubra]|uniref:apolipoprotein L3-like isoform X2 n=1 Tax=Haliotis rubra TaxID=36100 RepID=UPI001EE54F0A|nr:apolipoprotein L3-like isoform X2 [Haliotis rubra]